MKNKYNWFDDNWNPDDKLSTQFWPSFCLQSSTGFLTPRAFYNRENIGSLPLTYNPCIA